MRKRKGKYRKTEKGIRGAKEGPFDKGKMRKPDSILTKIIEDYEVE